MIDVLDLTTIAASADPAVAGVSILPPGRTVEPGWVVAVRADGVRVRIDGVSEESPAVAAVLAADLSAGAVAARALGVTRAEALPTLVTRADTTGIQVRAIVDAICTLANDTFEELGRGRPLTKDKLLTYLSENPTAGDPQ